MGRSRVDQTSLRLLPEAVTALKAVTVDRGCSRDKAVRGLLDEYVSRQETLQPRDRLTHVTAVLRYPPLPPGRYRPDGRVRVPVRLQLDTVDRVAALTLRLPGQPDRRGLKDYARRPLTEALVTAVAHEKPFDVPGLEGIPLIWTQAAATGLWRLTVAATLTVPEQLAILGHLESLGAGEDPTALAELLRDGDLAWHHPWRYEVALHLARNLLTGQNAATRWRSLKDQDDAFEKLRYDLERTDDLDHPLLIGAPKGPSSDMTGRGGSLVWRARRRLALRNVSNWIASEPTTPLIVSPPGVRITQPSAWTPNRVAAGAPLPAPVLADVENGRVLSFTTDEHTSAWPYLRETGAPVPGFDVVIDVLLRRRPEEVAELVLLNDPRLASVYLTPDVAHDLGFITAGERDELIEAAAKQTAARVEATLKRADGWELSEYAELVASRDDPERFFELSAEHYIGEGVVRSWWEWEAGTTVKELERLSGSPDRLRQLVWSRARYWKRQLEGAMQEAGRSAVVHGYTEPEDWIDDDAGWDEADLELGELFD